MDMIVVVGNPLVKNLHKIMESTKESGKII
jgi:hypothetical protein